MQTQYPFRDHRRGTLHVHLPTNNTFDRLSEDLAQSIHITIGPDTDPATRASFQSHLSGRYGGGPEDYPLYKLSRLEVLIQLPYYLRPEVVVQENVSWAVENGLHISTYFNNWCHYPFPTYRVKIRVCNYPLEFWDEQFFSLITSGFGSLDELLDTNDEGDNRGTVSMWVECRDLFGIPEYLILDFWILSIPWISPVRL